MGNKKSSGKMSNSGYLVAIEHNLPKELREDAKGYDIPMNMFDENLELIILILNSASLDTHKVKQEWFNMYKSMDKEHVSKLERILMKEKEELDKTGYNNKFSKYLRKLPTFRKIILVIFIILLLFLYEHYFGR